MPLIRDAKLEWSAPVTLDKDEVWQARWGRVYVTTAAAPEKDDGLCMTQNDGIRIGAGLQVRYRRDNSEPAMIAREVVQ